MNKYLVPIAIGVIVAAGGIAYWGFLPREQAAPTTNGNWQVFKNATYGYRIEYPTGWPVDAENLADVTFGNIPWEPAPGPFTVAVLEGKNRLFLGEFKQGFPDGCSEEKPVLVANLQAVEIRCTGAFAGETVESYFVERTENLYHLTFIRGGDLDAIFDRMVSTFRFD